MVRKNAAESGSLKLFVNSLGCFGEWLCFPLSQNEGRKRVKQMNAKLYVRHFQYLMPGTIFFQTLRNRSYYLRFTNEEVES